MTAFITSRAVMSSIGTSTALRNALDFGVGLASEARKYGGVGRCFWKDNSVWVEQTGLKLERFRDLAEVFARGMADGRETMQLKVEAIDNPSVDLGNSAILECEFVRERLTKKLMRRIPIGAYVVSNIFHAGRPAFAAILRGDDERDALWAAATRAGVANRTCEILWGAKDLKELYGIEQLSEGSHR